LKIKHYFLLFTILFICQSIFAQYKLSIVVKKTPATHPGETIFVAGSFNGWDPSKTALEYNKVKNTWQVELKDLKADVYEFKFTRGSWDKVQATVSGGDMPNYQVLLNADITAEYDIAAWKDENGSGGATKHHRHRF
jgi:hypothetical protein